MSEWENVKEKEKNARVVIHRPAAPLPFPGFFFEGAAIFTSAAENVGNLWNEACKHGLKAERCTHTHTDTRVDNNVDMAAEAHNTAATDWHVRRDDTWRHLHNYGGHFRFRFYLLPGCLL